MDEVKITSPFLTDMISKLIEGKLQENSGYKIDVHFHKIKADVADGKIYAHLDVDCGIEEDELMRILQKKIGYKIDINLNRLTADVVNEKIHAHLNVDCGIEENELMRILKRVKLIKPFSGIIIKPMEWILSKQPDYIFNLIKGKLLKKHGYKIDINPNKITTDVVNGKIHAHLDTDCVLEKDELMRILKEAGLI